MVLLILNYLIVFVTLAAIYLGCRAALELARDLLHTSAQSTADRSPHFPQTVVSAPAMPDRNTVLLIQASTVRSIAGSDLPERIAWMPAQQSRSAKSASVILF